MDLVQNLNISKQPVSSHLLQLAQGDPKWARVRHISSGGGYGGSGNRSGGGGGGSSSGDGRGGLGFGLAGVSGGRASVALTSSMMANSTFKNNNNGSSSSKGFRMAVIILGVLVPLCVL